MYQLFCSFIWKSSIRWTCWVTDSWWRWLYKIRVCETKWSNESPGGAFKWQNGLAIARWRGCAPTSSRLHKQQTPLWGVWATERSCVSKMEGFHPDKFRFLPALYSSHTVNLSHYFLHILDSQKNPSAFRQNGRKITLCFANRDLKGWWYDG